MATVEERLAQIQLSNADLVSAINAHTQEVVNKMGQIDQKVLEATQAVPGTIRSEMHKSVYVDSINGDDNNAGASPQSAMKTIQSAIYSIPHGGFAEILLSGSGDVDAPQEYSLPATEVNGQHISITPFSVGVLVRQIGGITVYHGGTVRLAGRNSMSWLQEFPVGFYMHGGTLNMGGFYGVKYTMTATSAQMIHINAQGSDYRASCTHNTCSLQNVDLSATSVSAKVLELHTHGSALLSIRGLNLGSNVTLHSEQALQVGTTGTYLVAK